jgi:hypothetical protein
MKRAWSGFVLDRFEVHSVGKGEDCIFAGRGRAENRRGYARKKIVGCCASGKGADTTWQRGETGVRVGGLWLRGPGRFCAVVWSGAHNGSPGGQSVVEEGLANNGGYPKGSCSSEARWG